MAHHVMTGEQAPVAAAGLFAGYRAPTGRYDETFAAGGEPRPHWQKVVEALENLGAARAGALLAAGAPHDSRKWRYVQRVRRRTLGMERPWELDPVPWVIGPTEWASPGRRPGAAGAAAERRAGGRVRPAAPARRGICCRRNWCSRTPAFCGPATAWTCPMTAACTSTPPTLRGTPDGDIGGCWPTAPRARRDPATRWRTARCCRASCPRCCATARCSGWRRTSRPCGRRCTTRRTPPRQPAHRAADPRTV